jgi:hypothetical protein
LLGKLRNRSTKKKEIKGFCFLNKIIEQHHQKRKEKRTKIHKLEDRGKCSFETVLEN